MERFVGAMRVVARNTCDGFACIWIHTILTERVTMPLHLVTGEAGSDPARVAELQVLIDAYNAVQAESLWPYVMESPIAIDKTGEEVILETDEYIYWPL